MVTTTDIAPNGDLVLVVDQLKDQRRFRVNSIILSMASKVFRSMLTPDRFVEGQASNEVKEISLHDDQAKSTQIILNVVHYNQARVPTTVSCEELKQLAILIDKYALHDCIYLAIQTWIYQIEAHLPDLVIMDVINLLDAVFTINDALNFERMTRLVMRNGSTRTVAVASSTRGREQTKQCRAVVKA